MAPDWILCLRHGEKPLDEKGEEEDGLSAAGEQRSNLLADALNVGGALLPDGAMAPSQIFVPGLPDGDRSHRTVAPLAARLGVVPVAQEKKDVGGLADTVLRSNERVVVICWEHDCLIAWLHRFAGKVVVTTQDDWLPCTWKKGRFDLLWRLGRTTVSGADQYEFSALEQALSYTQKLWMGLRTKAAYLPG